MQPAEFFFFLAKTKRVHCREKSYKYTEAAQRAPGSKAEGIIPPTRNPWWTTRALRGWRLRRSSRKHPDRTKKILARFDTDWGNFPICKRSHLIVSWAPENQVRFLGESHSSRSVSALSVSVLALTKAAPNLGGPEHRELEILTLLTQGISATFPLRHIGNAT
jgi:hypothetical protein